MTVRAEIILSEKGYKMLVTDSFKYSKAHTSKEGKIRWRCYIRSCPAKIYTNVADESDIIDMVGVHNHNKCTHIARQTLSTSVKRKAIEDISERPTKLIHRELINNDHKSDITTVDIKCVRRNMYVARRKLIPKLPKNQEDVITAVKKMEVKTDKEEEFVLAINELDQIIIFGGPAFRHE